MYGLGFGVGSAGATTILNRGGGFDADAQAFFTANSTLTDVTQKNAINQFYIDLKSYSLFGSPLRAFWFDFLGNATRCSYNGANPIEQTTYTSGWTFSSSGSKPNGTSAYCDTGINIRGLNQNSQGIGIYIRENINESSCDIGTSVTKYFIIASRWSTYFRSGINQAELNNTTNPNSLGLFSVTRTSSNIVKQFKNGSLFGSYSDTSVTPENYNIYKGAGNRAGIWAPSSKQFAFTYIDNGLTDTQVANLNTCVNTLMTTLGINV